MVLHCVIPILVGAVIYYLFSPNVIFVKWLDKIIGCAIHFDYILENVLLVRIIRFYFLDMLWGYALVFALYLILGNNTASLKHIFCISFVFSAFMEILQLTSFANGTFDFMDIFFEFIAEMFAVFIIKKITLEEDKK